MRSLPVLLILGLAGCGGSSTAPEGYIEACYGGDFGRHLSGKSPVYLANLSVDEAAWPRLTEILTTIAATHNVRLFNDTRRTDGLRMIHISLCSEGGLFMTADKRDWFDAGRPVFSPRPLMVTIFEYRSDKDWRPLIRDVDASLRAEWPSLLDTSPEVEVRLGTSLL